MEVDEDSLKRAALWLAEATNPMVVVGSGATECQREIKRLAELLSAPVVAFRNGKGILDSRHDLACAMPEDHALWRDTDVVIAIGTRLQPQRMGGVSITTQKLFISISIKPNWTEMVGRIWKYMPMHRIPSLLSVIKLSL